MEKISAETPFKSDLTESQISNHHEGTDKLMQIENNPDKIIRVETFDDLEERFEKKISPLEAAKTGSELYKELSGKYKIPVPVEFVIGKNSQGKDSVLGIADKIDGKNLSVVEITPEVASRVEEIYTKVAQYYFDRLYKDGPYLADINGPTQYVYGKRKGSEVSEIYLVDADLYFRSEKAALYNIVLWLVRHMRFAEQKCGMKFMHAREIIQQFLNASLPAKLSAKTENIISRINEKTRKYLQGEKITENTDIHPIFSEFEE